MQIQQVNRNDAEKVFLIVKNVDGGGSITTGMAACLVNSGASIDGISAVRGLAAVWSGFVGFAVQDIAINSYGLSQAWGLCNSVQLSNTTTSITVTAGDLLRPSTVAGTMFSGVNNAETMSTLLYKYAFVAVAPTTLSTAPSWTSAIVRAL